jgi:hypothetical protein
MKKIIYILVIMGSINLYSQPGVIVPKGTLFFEVANGTYIKDTNNEYLPYVGTWKGILEGKEYTFFFHIFERHLISFPNGDYYYDDRLKVKYEVKDITTGNVLFTTMSAINYDDYLILGLSSPSNGSFDFLFTDDANCYNSMSFVLENIPGVSNQLHYGGFRYEDFYIKEGCPYSNRINIPVPIPKKGLIFTKQ